MDRSVRRENVQSSASMSTRHRLVDCKQPSDFQVSEAQPGGSERSYQRCHGTLMALLISALTWDANPALAGPCAAEIAQMEAALDALPNPGAHQSTDAQLHRQPTPSSMARAKERAAADKQHDRVALERARVADARDDRDACQKALSEARHGLLPH